MSERPCYLTGTISTSSLNMLSLFGLFLTPAFYVVLRGLRAQKKPHEEVAVTH